MKKIKNYFESKPTIDVTAAHIGINKWTWTSIDSEDDDLAISIMKANKFDVLPIMVDGQKIEKYYATRDWNDFSGLNREKISYENKIYYRVSLEDLITSFYKNNDHYYFLTSGEEVVGLVSWVNLNCQPVFDYFYQLISSLEKRVSYFVSTKIEERILINEFTDSEDDHIQKILRNYQSLKNKGLDTNIYDLLYLQTLGIILKKHQQYFDGDERRLFKYSSQFAANGKLNKVRNNVMHPVKGMLNDNVSIESLFTIIETSKEINDLLDSL